MKLLLFISFYAFTFASKAPICTSVLFSANWAECDGILLYSYSIQMSVDIDKNNQTFPNIITLSKISEYTANYGYYYADTPITSSYSRFDNDNFIDGMPSYLWNSTDIPYRFQLPNGYIWFDLGFVDGIYKMTYDVGYPNLFIHKGEIFENFYPLNFPCLDDDPGDECMLWNVYSNQSICCNNYVYVDIPDDEQEVCQIFQSFTTIKDNNQDVLATLNASYLINNNAINLNVTSFKSYNLSLIIRYMFADCWGSDDFIVSPCIFDLPDDGKDIHYHFLIDYEWIDQNGSLHGYNPPAAIFVIRNGILLKDDNTLFTSKNPCWKLNAEIGYGNGANFDTSLCCTTFTTSSSTSKTTISPTPITESPVSCLQYSSTTTLSDLSVFLEVDYNLNNTGIAVSIANFTATINSSVQLEIYSPDVFTLPCKASTDHPTNTCFYILSDNKSYELKVRTSIYKDGFNMLAIIENNGKLISPPLTVNSPCYTETNPYNNANSNVTETTVFCCNTYG